MFSFSFPVLTFVVYMLLPELRAPLFGKITMIFVFCLFLAYFSISIVSFGHWKLVNERPVGMDYSPVCRILGFMVQFTYLQAFFWMNILSFDIYKTFCKVKLTKKTKWRKTPRWNTKIIVLYHVRLWSTYAYYYIVSGSRVPTEYLFGSKTGIWST